MKKKIILLGCGGHSRAIIDIVEAINQWQIIGLVGNPEDLGTFSLGYEVVATDESLYQWRSICSSAFVAVGQIGLSTKRKRLSRLLKDLSFDIPTLKAPSSVVSKYAKIGKGTSIGHGAVVNAGASIGDHCIINTNSLVEHDSNIGDFCHLSTGVIINGGVDIGPDSFIGSGSIIREGLALPASTVVSAGKRIMGLPLMQENH